MMNLPFADMIAPATIRQIERQQRPGVTLRRQQGDHVWSNPLPLEMMMTRKIIVIIVVAVLMYAQPSAAATNTNYFMDDYSVCTLMGYIDIPSGVAITIQFKRPGAPTSSLTNCVLRFRAENDKELLRIEYKEFSIRDCSTLFKVNLNTYRCNQAKPADVKLSTREVNLELMRPRTAQNYDGEILLATYQSNDPGPRDDLVSNPALIGVIVGSVCGVILLILLLAVIGICCYQRNSYLRGGHTDPVLRDGESTDMDKCYINNMEKNGSPVGGVGMSPSMRYTDIAEKFSDSKEEKNRDRLEGSVGHEENLLVIDALAMSPTKSGDFNFDALSKSRGGVGEGGGSGNGPRSPMIEALQSNPKFQASYQSTEDEAEKRAQRLSSTNNGGGGSGGDDDAPPTPPPPLPVITAPVPKMRTTNPAHAGIRRVPVRTSATSDDINLLERELLQGGQIRDEDGDPGIKVLKPEVVGGLATEIVPIKTQASRPKADVEIEDFDQTDLTNDDPPPFVRSVNSSTSTVHSLRPNRRRSPASKSKQQHQQGSASRNKDAGLSSLRKRGPKSPRITTKGQRLVSEAEEGSVYDDEQSVMGVRSSRADDLESLPPLRRSASRQSLFASRSSLYSRRGKKERRPSVADSLDSYAQDDLTLYSSGAQTQPMSEQDARAYKSLGSIIAPIAAETSTIDPSYSTGRTRKKSVGSSSLSHGRQAPKKSTSSHKSSMSTQTIEQKGTQTDREAAMNQQQQMHPLPLAKPLLKPTVKSVPHRNTGNGIGAHASQSVKLPPASSKSHFQPIAYNNTNVTTAPTTVTDPSLPPPQPTETLKSIKSPWELLCELTDTNTHTSPPSESGVSTLGPRFEPSPHFTAPSVQLMSLPSGPYTAQTTATATSQPLVSNNAGSKHSPSVTMTAAPLNPSVTPTPARYTPSSLVGSEISLSSHPPMTMDPTPGTLPTRKSSWDALTELADNQKSSTSHQNTESIV